ncbi:O-acetylhomoserine sulfhydrylase [Bacteroidia bacterium]|nr:O-acetylhomoserine sulfhydrylase [Bacteroidia bacterium]
MSNPQFNQQLFSTPYPKKDAYGALQIPLYHSVAFEFDTAEAMELAFLCKTADHTYSRISNPTVQFFEDRIAAITGAASVTALSSGMAAISNAIMALAYSGSNIVTSRHLFGNTYSLFASTLKDFGVSIRFCDLTDVADVERNIDKNTCAVFLEIITNPQLEVADLQALAALTSRTGVPLIADTTVVPFCAFSAKKLGVNIEIVSSTKYISGGATSLGGLIIDYGNFDWSKSPKINLLREAQPSAFTFKIKREIHRNLGAYMNPQTAYMQTLGLDTLDLRFQKAASACLYLATALSSAKGIETVNYTGLPGNKFYNLSTAQFGKYPGAMFTFDLPSRKACFEFMNRLKFIKRATNLFDNKTLAIHPESTIYGTFSPADKEKMNVSPKTIRLSVGLEEADRLLEDIRQALQ